MGESLGVNFILFAVSHLRSFGATVQPESLSSGLWGVAEIRGSQSLAPEGSDLGLGGYRFQQLMSLSLGQTAAGQKPGGTKLGGKGCRGHTGRPPAACWAVSQP